MEWKHQCAEVSPTCNCGHREPPPGQAGKDPREEIPHFSLVLSSHLQPEPSVGLTRGHSASKGALGLWSSEAGLLGHSTDERKVENRRVGECQLQNKRHMMVSFSVYVALGFAFPT